MIEFDDTTNETPEYQAFVEKFKHKKTSDDCYTPENVYNVIRDWAVREYGLEGRTVVRPFWPGGDYLREDYPDGCVVIDNPPFSILAQICRDYERLGIDYFMFAPSLTLFSTNSGGSNYIISGNGITYKNGATIGTAFVTNLGEYKVRTCPELYKLIKTENDKNTKSAAGRPKYIYPDCVATAATLQKLARYVTLDIRKEDASFARSLDAQRAQSKAIFGAGFLLSEKAAAEKAAAEKAAAEKAAAHRWALSEREIEIVRGLGDAQKA